MRRILLIAFALFAIVGFSIPAMAIGIGGAFSAGVTKVYCFDASEGDGDGLSYGGSLVFDTAVANNSLFNYRLNLAILAVDQETSEGSRDYKTEGVRYALYNSFGFGVVRTETVRFWLGPQFGLYYADVDTTETKQVISYYGLMPSETKKKYDDGGIGSSMGLVLGLNLNMGPVVTLGFDGGVRAFVTSTKLDGNYGPEGFINVSLIFRINDNY